MVGGDKVWFCDYTLFAIAFNFALFGSSDGVLGIIFVVVFISMVVVWEGICICIEGFGKWRHLTLESGNNST